MEDLFDPKDILHVQLAAEANLGIADMSLIEVLGERIESVQTPFIPFLKATRELFGAAEIIEEKTCTGCMGECVSTFIYLNKAGFHDHLSDLTLIMGTPKMEAPTNGMSGDTGEPKGKPVIIGRCAKDYRHLGLFVPGCPPHGMKITDAVCEALEIDKSIVHSAIVDLHDF